MRLENQLSRSIADRVDRVQPPQPDLDVVVRRGRIRHRRRLAGAVLVTTAVVTGALLASGALGGFGSGGRTTAPDWNFEPVGQLDYSDGLRAYMSPDAGGDIWLGGRSFPANQLEGIDTDATATPYGMVFFDSALQAHLLREDGTTAALAPAPEAPSPEGFRPSSKADAQLPLVAWTEPGQVAVTVRLHDLRADEPVDSLDVPCSRGACPDVMVEAVDRGLVFVRTSEGTIVWDPAGAGNPLSTLGGSATTVVDVRNQRILHTGPAPRPGVGSPIDDSWSFTAGPIDAQLSFDGGHVLNWSTRLQPTTTDGRPIELDLRVGSYVFVTFDTDGSVLVAVPRNLAATVYDCELSSGACTELGELPTESGDPIFVGDDM